MQNTPETPLIAITPGCIICRYQQTAPGVYAVVTSSGRVLAPSFFDLRHRYYFVASINGEGGWIVIAPRQAPQPKATQQALF